MKRTLFSYILISLAMNVYGQNTQWIYTPVSAQNSIWTGAKVAIGTFNYGNPVKLTIKSDYTPWSYFAAINTLPSDGKDGGLYLGSLQTDNAILGSGGTYNNSGKWLSKGSTLSAINLNNGNIYFINNTGLTANTEFYPTTTMAVTPAGVGIGTSDPQNKITICGTIGLFGDGLDGSTYQRTVIYSDVANGLYFDAPVKADNTGLPINFGWRGGSPKVTFLSSGNVLIGKTSQSNSTYKLDVVGKIRADEIVVNTTGADFVFEPDYKLRSLSELETFIRSNKHLPDIAPAKEMQENGVSAGEMQAKLLQKVEELTLYMIEKDKEIAEQQKENLRLKEELKELRKLVNQVLIKQNGN